MDEKQMNEALLREFPELKGEFEEYTAWQDGVLTGAFLTYEDVFRPRIEEAVERQDGDYLKRAGVFLEELFTSGDEYDVNVVTVGILEGLKANCDSEAVRGFLGAETLSEYDSLTY